MEHLALDADALRLEVPERHQTPRVAGLLALAEARSGSPRRARALLRHVSRSVESEIRAVLVQRALSAEDADELRAHLEPLRATDPATALRAEDALRRWADDAVAPLVQALDVHVAAGRDDEVRAAASALLAAMPGHPRARAALAGLERRQADERRAHHLAAAAAEEDAGRFGPALQELQRAAELGADVKRHASRVRSLAKERDAADALARALAAAAAGDPAPYLALPDALRALAQASDPRLLPVESFRASHPDPAAAVRALEHARAAARAGRYRDVLARLREAGIAESADAADLRRLADDALGREALDLLSALEHARDAGEDVAPRLAAFDGQILPPDGRGRLAELRRRVDRDRDQVVALRQLEELGKKSAIAGAIALARAWSDESRSGAEAAGWRRRLGALEAFFARLLPVVATAPWPSDLRDVPRTFGQQSADVAIEPDGAHAWVVEGASHLLFFWRIALADGRAERVLVARLLGPFTTPRCAFVDGHLVASARGGRMVSVNAGFDGAPPRVVACVADVDGQLAEPEYSDPGADPALRVVVRDIGRRPAVTFGLHDLRGSGEHARVYTDVFNVVPLRLPGRHAQLLVHETGGRVNLADPGRREHTRYGRTVRIDSATSHPDGGRIVVVGATVQGGAFSIYLLNPDGEPSHHRPLGVPRSTATLATSRSRGLVYLLVGIGVNESELRAFDADLQVSWSVRSTAFAHLLADPHHEHVVLALETARGPAWIRLGSDPPALPPDPVASTVRGTYPTSGPRPHVAGVGAAGKTDLPTYDDPPLRAAVAASDAAPSPAERFACLDVAAVWHARELQSLARLAEAAMQWDAGPWAQRLHAVATWLDVWRRWEQLGEGDGLAFPEAWADERLEAVGARAHAWEQQACADHLGLQRIDADDLSWWPPPGF